MHKRKTHIFTRIRFDYGLSQSDLGKHLNCSQAHISKIEKFEKLMTKEMKDKALQVFGAEYGE